MAAERDFAYWVDLVERSRESREAGDEAARAWLTAGVLLALLVPLAIYLAWVLYWKPRRDAARPGDPSTVDLVGEGGVATDELDPEGLCRVLDRNWPCRAHEDRKIPVGTPVLVVGWEPNRHVVSPRPEPPSSPARIEQAKGEPHAGEPLGRE